MNKMKTMIYCPKSDTIIIPKYALNDLYNICNALVAITEIECCYYNCDEEVSNAKNFIAVYENLFTESEDY